jgi:von Willebrand factor type A domain/Aerotolerance regulator N-terminal
MGFLQPLAWSFAALYSVLIILYLWERRRQRIEVPSLLLWESVPESVVRVTRFRPELFFFLQFLLLTLLILGLARPYLDGTGGSKAARHIFVLDLSASMQAVEGRQTRFESARKALGERIEKIDEDDESMLIAATRPPEVLMPFTRSHTALLRQLHELAPYDTGADLSLAVALAKRAAKKSPLPVGIEVYSDQAAPSNARGEGNVSYFQFGESDDNLAIEGLDVFQSPLEDPRNARANVHLHNYSHRETHGFLTLELDDQVFLQRGFSIEPEGTRDIAVDKVPGAGVLRARLDADDALAIDNSAYAAIRPSRPLHLLLVSPPSALVEDLESIGKRIPLLRVQHVTPEAYQPESGAESDVLVFSQYVPQAPPETAALYLYPPGAVEGVGVGPEVKQLPILDWQTEHAALQGFLPRSASPLPRTRVLSAPAWADVLVRSHWQGHDAPLVVAGEQHGRRVAVVGFDLAAEHLLRTDNLGILLLFVNLVDWLAPAQPTVLVSETGEVVELRDLPKLPKRVADPRGGSSDFAADSPVTIDLKYAGLYRVSVDGTAVRVLANFRDPSESDIGRPPRRSAQPPRLRAVQSTAIEGRSSSAHIWFYTAAVVLLLLEWVLAARLAR